MKHLRYLTGTCCLFFLVGRYTYILQFHRRMYYHTHMVGIDSRLDLKKENPRLSMYRLILWKHGMLSENYIKENNNYSVDHQSSLWILYSENTQTLNYLYGTN